ncbi:MAG: hypothetical protein WCI71_13635, partial [Bacteroidota bacterium]
CSGTWTKTGTSQQDFLGIRIDSPSTGTACEIQGNTIKNISWTSGYGSFGAIGVAGSIGANIGTTTPNVVGAVTGNGAITFTINTTYTGQTCYGITAITTGTVVIQNNIVGAITTSNLNTAYPANFCGVYSSNTGNRTISSNTIGSADAGTSNSIYASSICSSSYQLVYGIQTVSTGNVNISGNTISKMTNAATDNVGGTIVGILASNGNNTVSNNTIRNLTNCNTTSYSTGGASVIGISQISTVAGQTNSGNTIYNLSNTHTSSISTVTGIYYAGAVSGTNAVSGNFIHSLSVTGINSNAASIYGMKINAGSTTYANNIISLGGTTATAIYGIYETGASGNNNNFYFNTVYLSGSNSQKSSYALYSAVTTNSRNIRNNIFRNARTYSDVKGPGSTPSPHYAVYFGGTGGTLTCDYNDYFVSVPGGVLGFYGIDKSALPIVTDVTGNDVHSQAIDPLFAGAGGILAANYKPSATSLVAVPGTGITTDYGANPRSETYPAMGAWEYSVTPPCANPTIGGTIAQDQNICSGSPASEITSSVPASGQTGILEYKWQKSIVGSSSDFEDIASTNSETYSPGSLTQTTWFKRLARVTCMNDWSGAAQSNVVRIFVFPVSVEVTNTNDDGPGSLRQAIADICTDGTITFNSSLNGSAITLTSGELAISKGLTIDATALTSGIYVSGNNASRVFLINGPLAATTITLKNLKVTNGYTTSDGGGISFILGTLNLDHCEIFYSYASRYGGGLYLENADATLNCSNSTIRENSAVNYGGGVFIYFGHAGFTGTTISGNLSSTKGGGVFIWRSPGTVSFAGCTFNGNKTMNGATADINYGGGLFIDNATVTISNCEFTGNEATRTDINGPKGGAIYLFQGNLTVTNSSFTFNLTNTTYGKGGAIYNDRGILDVSLTNFTSNSAGRSGGAIFNLNALASTTNTRCNFITNTAGYLGGAIYLDNGTLTSGKSTFTSNSAVVFTEGAGGAIDHNNGTSTTTNCYFTTNSSKYGGAIYVKAGNASVVNCLVRNNSAVNYGGGFAAELPTASLTITNTTVVSNYAGGGGGGIGNLYGSTLLNNSVIWDNTSDGPGKQLATSGT